jgi:hypothetical protein
VDTNHVDTITATVSSSSNGTPTGSVSFYDGTKLLGTMPLSGGVATCNFSSLTLTKHMISAQYNGDGNFLGSTSAAIGITVTP